MKKFILAATALVGAASAPAGAVTIDFQELQGACTSYGVTLDSQGYRFNTSSELWSCDGPSVGVSASSQGLVGYNSGEIGLERVDGGAFSLRSIFTGNSPDFNPNAYAVSAVGMLLGGGSVSAVLNFSGSAFQRYMLPTEFTNLTSVSFHLLTSTGSAELIFIDDVVAEEFVAAPPEPGDTGGDQGPAEEPNDPPGGPAVAVPEPGMLGLLGLGTLALGIARRRRRSL